MPASAAPVLFPADFPAGLPLEELLHGVLALSLTGLVYYLPVYDPAGSGEVVDLAFAYLNPAAQRMLRLPARPPGTHLDYFPESRRNGSLDFHRDTFLSGEPGTFETNYQADGYDNYFRVAGRRLGEGLLVSFTDTGDHPRTPVEAALRARQAELRTARAEAEAQRQQLQQVLHQAPVAIALLEGPTYRILLANPTVCELWTRPSEQLLGVPLLEALPELQGQGVDTLLNGVLRTGEPFYGTELPFDVVRHGRRETIYFNFVYHPQRNAQGQTTGVLVVASDVTPVVTARLRVEAQEQETAALNEELAAANEEIRANNDELHASQLELLRLNQELELRVQQRTREADAARADAEQQRNRLERLFQQAPAYINLFTGPDHVLTLVHPQTEQLLPGRQLLGLPRRQALPELPEEQHAPLDRVYRTGEAERHPGRLTRLDQFGTGELQDVYLDVVYQPLFDLAGRPEGVLSFAVDVTEQVLARQQREAERQQLQAVFAQAPVAVCVFQGEDYVLDLVNPPMSQMLGRPLAALLGQPFFEVLPELRSQGLPDLLAGVRRTGLPFVAQEQRLQLAHHSPGHPGYYNYVYQPLYSAYGQVTGVVCVATDVSEQVLARQQVQDLNEELAAINEELQATNEKLLESNTQLTRTNVDLDNFIYTASHDLKAPIANLEGLLQLLREELPLDVAQGRYVAPILMRMVDAVDRFKRTIDHLTEVSKLQKEHSPILTLVDLAAVVEDVRQDLAPLLRDTNAQLTVAVTDSPPLLFSEKNLRSVVYNLLSNALKYRHPNRRPHVDVRAHLRPGHTVLEVHDNGLGIAETHLPRLFTMFQRFHDHVEGTGIGLYMVKRMVDNAGGRLEVHSQLGAGTTFFVHLPHAPLPTP
ncbi:PAS domain-containing protein (plasmid) [Hymenobacter sp. BRD128]|uniref:PAS domain-containing sensor histidine kinase n=1 Tax=Hymenobacter sp. BRD128 TaxID=2675878 RepID=UPI0015640B9E|nr:PAS domain-containing protein [Hymenobacter sp. BRD128]QKG59212.1 PAS domain-containing protein [Hymenobacter sp. BRD128]